MLHHAEGASAQIGLLLADDPPAPEPNATVPYSLIKAIVAQRNTAIARQHDAYKALEAAQIAIDDAEQAAREAAGGERIDPNRHRGVSHRNARLMHAESTDEDTFARETQRNIDAAVWHRIMEHTHLRELMDHTAKEQLRDQIEDAPPEITEATVRATIESLIADADNIFLRGIATCFAKLDRRFRSHDGFKIGARIILDNVFDEHGMWRFRGPHKDLLADIERTLRTLDEAADDDRSSLVDLIENERRTWSLHTRACTIEHHYCRIRIFKKGTCHLWFKDNALVERINALLAQYYGATLGDGSNARRDEARNTAAGPGSAVAKHFGFFPTPPEVVKIVMGHARLTPREPPLTVLEPSAGSGSLARAAADTGALVDCVEIQPGLAGALHDEQRYRAVTEADFLHHRATPARRYDRIVMNPPFDHGHDIAHVEHALGFLAERGTLLAIMSAGAEFRDTRQGRRFQQMIAQYNARWIDLPERAFATSGTNVNTVLLVANADRTPPQRWR